MAIAHRKPHGKAVGHRTQNSLVVNGSSDPPPDPPGGLLSVSIRRWEAFWTSPVAAAVDRRSDMARLERWITTCDEYERARKQLRAEGRIVRGSTGQPALNPLAQYISQLEAQIRSTETEFGMTPMSRLRLGIAVGEAARSLAELNAEIDDDDTEAFDPRTVIGNPLADNGSASA